MLESRSSQIYSINGNIIGIILKGTNLLNCRAFNTCPITNSSIFNPIFSSFHREGLGSKNWKPHWLHSRRRGTEKGSHTWAVILGTANSTVADVTNSVLLVTCSVALEIKLNLKESEEGKPFYKPFAILFPFWCFYCVPKKLNLSIESAPWGHVYIEG